MKTDLILIVGASGTVGSNITKNLKSQGYRVRTTTSRPVSSSNGEQVHMNLATGEGLKEAFEGVDRAFFLSPPGHADMYKMLSPLIQEAKRRGLKKVVLMTAMGANAADTPFRRAEVELEKSGLNYNIIRPNWFMQNFNTFWVQGIRDHSKILLPTGSAKGSFIDARDISDVATKLLIDDSLKNKDFDITGSEALDHDEVAKLLSEGLGRKITYEEIAPETLLHAFLAAGLPKDYAEFLIVILHYFKLGAATPITQNVKLILGKEPRSFKQYVQDFKAQY